MGVGVLTLKNGMNIMGDINNYQSEKYIIKQPVLVMNQNTQNGPAIGFAPFLDFTEEFESGITIKSDDILCSTTPIRELYNKYNEVFGSGIQVVSAFKK